jgi:hypothetical protein
MKHLHTSPSTKLSIAILDPKNFGVGKITKQKNKDGDLVNVMQSPAYYSKQELDKALAHIADQEAELGCDDVDGLRSYIAILCNSLDVLKAIVREAMGL